MQSEQTFLNSFATAQTTSTSTKIQLKIEIVRGKRGIKVTGALRSAGFQKIPARPQIVFNRSTGLNMLV